MRTPVVYENIRPFDPEELPQVFDRLLADPQFSAVLNHLYPDVPRPMLEKKMRSCTDTLSFQKAFSYVFLKDLLQKRSKGATFDASVLDKTKRYTFLSNHRDIVLDAAFLSVFLIDAGFDTTCEVAIGDNLLATPWIKDLARLNKSFIVQRSLPPRQMLEASKRLSEYMHFVVREKRDNVWIAQREGRAKDSNDRTQPALLKMLAMGGEGNCIERWQQLHIVPLTISYEYDPCDYLKAREFQLKRDNPDWKKSAADDVISMQTGIMGYKGRIHFHCGPSIDRWLSTLDPELSKAELPLLVAKYLDGEIYKNYCLYPSNYVADDLLTGENRWEKYYSDDDRREIESYFEAQLAKIDIENKDEDYLRERLYTMYANPLRNHCMVTGLHLV